MLDLLEGVHFVMELCGFKRSVINSSTEKTFHVLGFMWFCTQLGGLFLV
jgi:hypothetical protein